MTRQQHKTGNKQNSKFKNTDIYEKRMGAGGGEALAGVKWFQDQGTQAGSSSEFKCKGSRRCKHRVY